MDLRTIYAYHMLTCFYSKEIINLDINSVCDTLYNTKQFQIDIVEYKLLGKRTQLKWVVKQIL